MTAVTGVYTTMWNVYLNEQLKYTSNSSFTDLNDQAFQYWDFSHIDPTGAQKGLDAKGNVILYTAGDLAAVMALNVDLKVLSANGFYDFVTPFYQTVHRSAADAACQPAGAAEPIGAFLSVGAYGLSRRRLAHRAESGSREDV